MVARLVPPTTTVRASFVEAMLEFHAEGRGALDDVTRVGHGIQRDSARWTSDAGFAEYVRDLRAEELEETPRPEGYVPQTTLWWVDGDTYLGGLAIRHRLTPALREVGGHIGYDVRPSARRRGHATTMLRAALPIALGLGVDPALITCDETNLASRTVIERCGGVLDSASDGKLRYWVPTSASRG
jgi:predicted acetyltransferase